MPRSTELAEMFAGRYRIDREIGRGGMASVYRARDLRHERDVAIKVLRDGVTSDLRTDRFAREIRMVAGLTHPHILPLFDSGERDGCVFFVMPLLEGESLRERLDRVGQLPIEEVVQFASEVADALDYAHRHGVVHRDVKPENVMVHEGHALIADFGVGRALTNSAGPSTLTQTGMLVGTPAYMSPEQAAGDSEIDGRSDLYSLGCVLFELITGEQPFVGATLQSVIAKRFIVTPPPVTAIRPAVPSWLARAVARLLARDPVERFATGHELVTALRTGAPAPARHDEPSIAVLPFANMSADPDTEYFSDGITEEILNALARLSGLRVMARTSSFAFKGRNVDVRAIGAQLGARYMLEGSVRRSGDRVRITAQLVDATEGHHLWSERYDRDLSDVFAVQDEITGAIRDALGERLLGIGHARASLPPAIEPDTYELFLRGRHLIERRIESADRGVAIMEEVVRRAPAFAPAYVELATAHMMRVFYGFTTPADGWPLVRELGEKAVAIDPHHAQARFALAEVAFFWEWNWDKAGRLYRRALELDANDADTLATYGMYLASMGRFDESRRASAQAVARDPLNPIVLVRAMICQYLARQFGQTIATCDHTIELLPDFPESYRWKGLALLAMGRVAESIAQLQTAVHVSGRNTWAMFDLGLALVAAQRLDEARALAAELEVRAASAPVPAYTRTLGPMCATPPDLDGVFARLETWYAERGFWMVMLAVEPTFDWLRGDARFDALVARVGIPRGR